MNDQAVEAVKVGLQQVGWSALWIDYLCDRQDGGISLKTFTATVSTPEMHVFEVFAVTGGGQSNFCNKDMFPSVDDAVAYHIGKLVVEGGYRIVAG